MGNERNRRPSSKVARLIETYDLGTAFGAELEARWTADGPRRKSLRDLATLFNHRLLEAALADAGTSTVDGEVANLYRLLTDEDVSSGMRMEARARLERDGVDVDELESDFVTYQAIRTYLANYRGAEYDGTTDGDRVDRTVETVQRLRSRIVTVVEESLDRLRAAGRLTLGEFRLFVDVTVLCTECDTQYRVVELLKRGGCDCETDGGTS
jgi:hypothetical protein